MGKKMLLLNIQRNAYHLHRCIIGGHRHHMFHTSAACYKRRGATSDVKLPELIADKPPDYYPSIRDKLNRINYYDYPTNEIDVGFGEETDHFKNFIKTSLKLFDREKVELTDEELFEGTSLDIDYEKISKVYLHSKESIEHTISLAHHYGIFRDLFFKEPAKFSTKTKLIKENAKNEADFDSAKHLPKLYYFRPIVPIVAEFCKEEQDGQIIAQTSYRGNLIPAEYGASVPPVVTIDSSGIHEEFKSIDPATESAVNLNAPENVYYTLALVNLDSHFNDTGVCHWMLANIHKAERETKYETIIKYLPIHGIKGLGYHRYAFVLFEHQQKVTQLTQIEDFDLAKRRFNGLQLMDDLNTANPDLSFLPIGLSWFQTTWDDSCRDVYYKYLNMRIPTYEYQFPKQITEFKQVQYPGRAPFNMYVFLKDLDQFIFNFFNRYLDCFRDPKELNKEVLNERLKQINLFESYDPTKMYSSWSGKPQLPNIHPISKETPSWLETSILQKRGHVGRFRGLRASSAKLPFNNNADLDRPLWPRIPPTVMPLNCPNPYPDGKRRPKLLKDTLWHKPIPEHHSIRVNFADTLDEEDKKIYEKVKSD